MKRTVIVALTLAVTVTAAFAFGQTCHTNCWRDAMGNQHCTTQCY